MAVSCRLRIRLALAVALAASGCGRRLPPTAPVSGTITIQGRAVAGAAVSFVNDSAPRFAIGRTDAEGRYTLTTFTPGDGAVLGEHRVVVLSTPRVVGDPSRDPQGLPTPDDYRRLEEALKSRGPVPEVYTAAGTTPLRAEVRRGPNRCDFDLRLK